VASNGATSIWSGYNHQGRVGLFVGLREVNRLKDRENQDLNKWKLIFELGEDFQIIHETDYDTIEVVSRHQVKAYNSTAPSKYSKVFTRHQKKNSKDEIVTDEDGTPIMEEGFNVEGVQPDSRFIHVIKELDISEWQNDYGIQLYEYPAENESDPPKKYCDFSRATQSDDELMRLAVREIEQATRKNVTEASLIWKELQHSLQTRISVAHHEKSFVEYTLHELQTAISNPESLVAYDADKGRQSVLEYGEDFIGEREDLPTFTDSERSRVVSYIQDLTTLDNDSLLASLRYLHINNSGFLGVNSNGMKKVVYTTLSRIVSCEYEPNCIQYNKDGSSYILTVINEMKQSDDDAQRGTNKWQTEKVVKALLDKDVAMTFKKAKIINQSLDADFDSLLGEELSVSFIADRKVYEIIEPAPLEFVSVDRAVSEINGE